MRKLFSELLNGLLFYGIYLCITLLIWLETNSSFPELFFYSSIGMTIVPIYLLIVSKRKRAVKKEPDLYAGFRRLFSDETGGITK